MVTQQQLRQSTRRQLQDNELRIGRGQEQTRISKESKQIDQETLTKIQIGKGGATVELSSAQVRELNQLLSSERAQRGAAGGSFGTLFYGRDKSIQKAGVFAIEEAQRRGVAVAGGVGLTQEQRVESFKRQTTDFAVTQKTGAPRGEIVSSITPDTIFEVDDGTSRIQQQRGGAKVDIDTKNFRLPTEESKFQQPTTSTRTDLQFRDVIPERVDVAKDVRDILGTKVGEVSEFQVFQKSTLVDGTPGATSPKFEGRDILLGETLSAPVDIPREVGVMAGITVTAGLNLFGAPTITKTIPEQQLLQTQTIGGASGIIPEQEIVLFSPEGAGKAVEIGTEIGTFAAISVIPGGQVALGVGFGASGTETALDVELPTSQRVLGGAEALLGAGILAAPVIKSGISGVRDVARSDLILTTEIRTAVGKKLPTLIGKPSTVIRAGDKQITVFDEIRKLSEVPVTKGKRVILETVPKNFLQRKVKISLGEGKGLDRKIIFELTDGEVIFSGSARLDPQGFKKALDILQKRGGRTEKEARDLLREIKPKILKEDFKGRAIVIESPEGSIIKLYGEGTKKPIVRNVRGQLSRGGETQLEIIDAVGTPIGTKGEAELLRFSEVVEKAFLTKEGRPVSKLRQAGKTTEQFDVLSGVKKVGEVELPIKKLGKVGGVTAVEIGEFGVYKQAGVSQKIIPKRRSIERAQDVILAEKGKPEVVIDLDEVLGRTDVTVIKGGGKKSSPEFFQQLYSQEESTEKLAQALVTKQLPVKVKGTPKTPTPKLSTIEEVREGLNLPTSVGGVGLTEIPFEGTGQFERTEGGLLPGQLGGVISDIKIQEKQIGALGSVQSQVQIQEQQKIQEPILELQQRSVLDIAQQTKVKVDAKAKVDAKVKVKMIMKLKQIPRLGQELQQINILDIVQTTPRPRPRLTRPTPIIIPPPIISSIEEPIKEQAKKILDGFKVFVRKGGKDVEIAEVATKVEAKQVLTKRLRGTLRASGFVEKDSEKVRLDLFGSEFRPGKKDPLVVVERKQRRIKSGTGEVPEIQFFRKQAKGSKSLF